MKENFEKVIVLINADNPIEIEDLKNDDEIGAILGESPQYLKNLLAEGREVLREEGSI